MKLLIDNIKLKLLLEQKRDYIKHPVDGVSTIVSAIGLLITLLCSNFHDTFAIDGMVWSTLAWAFCVTMFITGIYQFVKSRKRAYTHTALYADIENINEVLHRFSIVAVKDTFNEYANRFLLYYDTRWDCWFFFSFPTSEVSNAEFIRQRLSNALKIPTDDISLKYISDRIQPKYSESDKIHKVFQHSLYNAKIYNFTDTLKADKFDIDGTQYRWMTISEMEQDERISSKNKDVVDFVKEKIV